MSNLKIKNILFALFVGGALYFLVNVISPNTFQPRKQELNERYERISVVDGPPIKVPNTLNYTALGLALCTSAILFILKPLKESGV